MARAETHVEEFLAAWSPNGHLGIEDMFTTPQRTPCMDDQETHHIVVLLCSLRGRMEDF